ncbi:MAG: hypothetical protein P8Y02_08140 [Deinococcales bacterium]
MTIPTLRATTRRLTGMAVALLALAPLAAPAAAQTAPGQPARAPPGPVAAAATRSGVLLRWFAPDHILPKAGFVVVRTGGGTTKRIAVASPMPEKQAVADGYASQDEYAYLTQLFAPGFGGSNASSGDAAFARAIGVLQTVARPRLARALGLLIEDKDVTAGVSYRYQVRVAGTGGRVIGAVRITAGQPTPLRPASGLVASYSAGAVHLHWARPAASSLETAYEVYRRNPDGSRTQVTADPMFLPAAGTAKSEDFLRDPKVTPGQRYAYTVVAIDLFGRRAAPSAPLAFTVPAPTPLPRIAITRDDVLNKAIRLHWTAPTDPQVKGVAVLRTTDPAKRPTQITTQELAPDATSYLDKPVQGGVNYYYALAAVDADGRLGPVGPLWSERGADFDPPDAPTGLTLKATTHSLQLSWQAPPQPDVASYKVFAGRDSQAPLTSYQLVAQVTTTHFSQPVPPNSLDSYSFRVVAVNATDVASKPSAAVTGKVVDKTPPPAPVLTSITPSDGAIALRWAGNANPDIHVYRLLRATAGGAYEQLGPDLAPGTSHFVDHQVTAGTRYDYELVAVDAAGNASPPSAALTATAFNLARPGSVTGLTASASKNGVQLSWQALDAPGVAYAVERDQGGGVFVQISDPLTATRYVDAGGAAGDRYRIVAVVHGRIGEPSAVATATAAP